MRGLSSLRRTRNRGFTLVELMIVVVVVGILATLGSYGVSRYIASSKTGEAIQMIGSIKAAQESYKDETFQYLDVSGTGKLPGFDNLGGNLFYPTNDKLGEQKVMWGGRSDPSDTIGRNWATLGVSATGPVNFVYACAAGNAGSTMAPLDSKLISVGNWPVGEQGAPWYAVEAVADLERGGEKSVYVGASFTTQIFSAHEGE